MDLTDLFIGMNTKQKQGKKNSDNDSFTRFPFDSSFQGVRRLFVLAFRIDGENNFERNSHQKYF